MDGTLISLSGLLTVFSAGILVGTFARLVRAHIKKGGD